MRDTSTFPRPDYSKRTTKTQTRLRPCSSWIRHSKLGGVYFNMDSDSCLAPFVCCSTIFCICRHKSWIRYGCFEGIFVIRRIIGSCLLIKAKGSWCNKSSYRLSGSSPGHITSVESSRFRNVKLLVLRLLKLFPHCCSIFSKSLTNDYN